MPPLFFWERMAGLKSVSVIPSPYAKDRNRFITLDMESTVLLEWTPRPLRNEMMPSLLAPSIGQDNRRQCTVCCAYLFELLLYPCSERCAM